MLVHWREYPVRIPLNHYEITIVTLMNYGLIVIQIYMGYYPIIHDIKHYYPIYTIDKSLLSHMIIIIIPLLSHYNIRSLVIIPLLSHY